MSSDMIVMTDHDDSFLIMEHIDETATDMNLQASWNTVDVKGGVWWYKGTPVNFVNVTNIGGVGNPYIVATVDRSSLTGTITAEAVSPAVGELSYKRLIGELHFDTDPGPDTSMGEYPPGPWNGQQVITHFSQYLRSTQYTSGRWTVSVDSNGYIECDDGIWMNNGLSVEWSRGNIKPNSGTGTVNVSTLGNGVHNVIAIWSGGSGDRMSEPVTTRNKPGYDLDVRLASAGQLGYVNNDLADRNWKLLAKITISGGQETQIEQIRNDDITTDVDSLNEELYDEWVQSVYYGWLGTTPSIFPNRKLLDRNPLAFVEEGNWELGEEYKQADTSWNMFVSQATTFFDGTNKTRGPDGTPLWVSVDTHFDSTHTTKDQHTIEIRQDPAATGAPPYNYYYMGLTNLHEVRGDWGSQKQVPYFVVSGTDNTAQEPTGELKWSAPDATFPLRVDGTGNYLQQSIDIPNDNDVIALYDFPSAGRYSCVMTWHNYPDTYPRHIDWKWPIKWGTRWGQTDLTIPTAPDYLWTGVPLEMYTSGDTLYWRTGNVTWNAGESTFGRDSVWQSWVGGGGTEDCGDMATRCGWTTCTDLQSGGDCCDEIIDCVTGGGSGNLYHDETLPGASGSSLWTLGAGEVNPDHDDRYWYHLNGTGGTDTKNFETTGNVGAYQFYIESFSTSHYWDSTNFHVEPSTQAYISADDTAYFDSANDTTLSCQTGVISIQATGISGGIDLDAGSAFGLDMYSGGSFKLHNSALDEISSDGASPLLINAGGPGGMKINSVVDIDMDANGGNLDMRSTAGSLLYGTTSLDLYSGGLTYLGGTSGGIYIDAGSQLLNVDCGTIDLDASTAIDLLSSGSASLNGVTYADLNSPNSYCYVSDAFCRIGGIGAGNYLDLDPSGNLQINGVNGAGGSFTTTDGKTVTVTKGIITAIV